MTKVLGVVTVDGPEKQAKCEQITLKGDQGNLIVSVGNISVHVPYKAVEEVE